ncbi:uncharacterized protein L201_004991 [Kwoniella dendrophila CBS 6074]|uniref:Chromo domain-containing protein n=1 Tax=Kwoniella dendrophila CBS 6074 TaxID=1295534 RepID=A0AAX4JZW2_9TREE
MSILANSGLFLPWKGKAKGKEKEKEKEIPSVDKQSNSNVQLPTPPVSQDSSNNKARSFHLSLTPDSSLPSRIHSHPASSQNSRSSFSTRLNTPIGIRESASSSIHCTRNSKEDGRTTKVLGSITQLLIKQSEIIKNREDPLIAFQAHINQRLNDMEAKIKTLKSDHEKEEVEIQAYIKDKIEEFVNRLSTLHPYYKEKQTRRNNEQTQKLLKGNYIPHYPIHQSGSDDQSQVMTPSSSEICVNDLINFDDFINFDDSIVQDEHNYNNDFAQIENPTLLDTENHMNYTHTQSRKATSPIPAGTHVDQAVNKQKALLNSQNVLHEGENTVDFIFRRRLRGNKSKDNFKIDMSFLDEISIDKSIRESSEEEYAFSNNLSSGIDSLPGKNTGSSPGPSTTKVYPTRNHNTKWNPFPLTYMREPTRSKSGVSLVEDRLLLPGIKTSVVAQSKKRRRSTYHGWSNGNKKRKKPNSELKGWPDYGTNTIKSRMEEIICDTCGGRVHWACAGLGHGKNMRDTPWSCPGCLAILLEVEDGNDGRMPSIPRAQQERCLRPNCIYSSQKKIVRKNDDVNEFYMEKIIGRKRLHFNLGGGGGATYMYLVRWYDWEIYDSTWEPARNIPDLPKWEAHFLQSLKSEGPDIHTQKVLLAEECKPWFDHRGKYNTALLLSMNLEKRLWWED